MEGVSTVDFEPTSGRAHERSRCDLHSGLAVNAVTRRRAAAGRAWDTPSRSSWIAAYDAGESVQVAVDYEGYPADGGLRGVSLVGAKRRSGDRDALKVFLRPQLVALQGRARRQGDDADARDGSVGLRRALERFRAGGTEALARRPGADLLVRGPTRWLRTWPRWPSRATSVTSCSMTSTSAAFPAAMPCPCYVYPDHWDFGAGEPLPAQKAGCDELPGMLETLSALFGQYPFVTEKYGVVETGGYGGLSASMEHQTLSSMWKIDNYSDIMAHEFGKW